MRCCMIEISSVLPQKALVKFGNLRKIAENVRRRLSDLQPAFEESSEIFGKCSEILEKSSKKSSLVRLLRHKMIHGCL